jgi:hypothetical protein
VTGNKEVERRAELPEISSSEKKPGKETYKYLFMYVFIFICGTGG